MANVADVILYSTASNLTDVVLRDGVVSGKVDYTLICSAGAYTYTGNVITLTVERNLPLAAGNYTYTGNAATLQVARNLPLSAGAYVYTGNSITLSLARNLALSAGNYTYTGNDATLDYVPGSSAIVYTLTCDTGEYVYSGNDAVLDYVPGIVNYDTHDGGDRKKRDEDHKKAQERLRNQLEQAFEEAEDILPSVELEKIKESAPEITESVDVDKIVTEVNVYISNIYMKIALEKAAKQEEDDIEALLLLS
jgi:hypothetical protein